jgi:hypothetical protein
MARILRHDRRLAPNADQTHPARHHATQDLAQPAVYSALCLQLHSFIELQPCRCTQHRRFVPPAQSLGLLMQTQVS